MVNYFDVIYFEKHFEVSLLKGSFKLLGTQV
jgi:hypothetical protein